MSRTAMTTKSVQFSEFGGVEVLEFVEVRMPEPGPGEVLVEVLAAGINHIEAYIRQGRFADEIATSKNQTQGSDFAGIVVAVGNGVTQFKRNSEVLGHARMSSHAYHIVVKATSLVMKPKQLPWEVAGALFLAGLAAHDLVEQVHVGEGDTVVVSAAAGGVGSIEIQLAKLRGATVIGTCGERNFDYLRQLGIKPVVYGDGIVERIEKLAPNGVDAYLDNFGQDGEGIAKELGVDPSRYTSSEQRKDLELKAICPDADGEAHNTEVLGKLATLAADRRVSVLISGYYPFGFVRDAFDDLEKRHARGKIVLGMKPAHSLGIMKARDVSDARD
ncbi:NADP-dependent oxidoreductase [Subtercola boreus]|uniref:Zinc-binding dehydrogenase n=1 Tax=Subtercola boreus TaxID=120213 RepID=A0A3E0WAG0_9MICO|nr:NADP-dependent oxidoreductase [Subtercola boreus]RFA20606.1 zinc-binding dehydrogenase [Subtercola boreus]RFA20720.1 zinc-binding dehydrogenase [Subtercola boreus]RFA26931.1 zinc-binding dehydrogenase [Subtercola boreus]